MAFETGLSGNPNGRKPGTPNKATTAAREVISAALAGFDAEILQAKMAALDGKDFIDAYVKLAEFIALKLQSKGLAILCFLNDSTRDSHTHLICLSD